MEARILVLLACVLACSAQIPDLPPLQCIDLDVADGIDHLRCHSGQVISTTVARTVNQTLGNVLTANRPAVDPKTAIAISNLNGLNLTSFEYYEYAGQIHDKGESLYPNIFLQPGETVLLLFVANSHSRDATKGLVALDMEGTGDKLVVAFDVDRNRADEPILKYNAMITRERDSLGHRLWYSLVGSDGFDAFAEDPSEFNEIVDSGVVIQASMSHATENSYMVRIDSTGYN